MDQELSGDQAFTARMATRHHLGTLEVEEWRKQLGDWILRRCWGMSTENGHGPWAYCFDLECTIGGATEFLPERHYGGMVNGKHVGELRRFWS